jgi:PAS domain-containing protein
VADAEPPAPGLLAGLLHDAGELAAVLDPDGTFRSLNPAGRRLLGLRGDDGLPTTSAFDLVAPVDRPVLEVDLRPALDRQGSWSGNLALVTR